MTGALWIKAAGLWIVMLALAVALGTLRQFVLEPALGAVAAHWIGTLVVAAVFFALIAAFVLRTRLPPGCAAIVGAGWAAMTIAFETCLARFVLKQPWQVVAAAYDPTTGSIWLLVPATLLLAPVVVARRTGHA